MLSIDVRNVSLQFGTRRVLDDCSFSAELGESIAFLGPNGAGKSSLLEVVQGLRRPSSGNVQVLGEDPFNASFDFPSRMGVVLQNWRDHQSWKPRELIALVESAHRNLKDLEPDRVERLIADLGLEHLLDRKISFLSGGERRRLDVCLALLPNPEVLILDEPTTGFDPEVRRDFHDLMHSVRGESTLLWATHDLAEAQRNCDRVIVLRQGTIAADASTDELRNAVGSRPVVKWTDGDGAHEQEFDDRGNSLLVELAQKPGVKNIRVEEPSLEDVYLAILDRPRAEDHT
jgi:ABC-2 type transport system ATP-binding protein